MMTAKHSVKLSGPTKKGAMCLCTNTITEQEVVTYILPVEAFATGIKVFDQQKVCLIT